MIIIVFGLPGSGKSYFASALAKTLQIKAVNSDVIRKERFAVRHYTPDEKMQVYEEMRSEMETALRSNNSLVLDATFYQEDIRRLFTDTAEKYGQSIRFIEVRADEEIIRKRLSKKREYSEADYEVYEKIKNVFEPLSTKHLILNSTQDNISDMIKKASNYLHQADGNK